MWTRIPLKPIALIFASSVLLKLWLIGLLPYSLYYDVISAINFGKGYLAGGSDHLITSKTFAGPVLWYLLYHTSGVWGLKLFNLCLFVLLSIVHVRLGQATYPRDASAMALFLFAFYPGTNLNVVAGEQDDCVTVLLFSLGVLLYVRRRVVFPSALLMGIAFVFKFSAAIFYAGFALYVLITREKKELVWSVVGMTLPYALINLGDDFESMRNLLHSFDLHMGYSTWMGVGFKVLSTGLLISTVLSWWTWVRKPTEAHLLCCLIPSAYLLYVLVSRDAFSASYVMMQGIFFFSFPLAEFVLRDPLISPRVSRKLAVGTVLAAYLTITTVITVHNVVKDPLDARSPDGPIVLCE